MFKQVRVVRQILHPFANPEPCLLRTNAKTSAKVHAGSAILPFKRNMPAFHTSLILSGGITSLSSPSFWYLIMLGTLT
jgi:hypothetical protein